jgi:deazaflavin-dependent oxidoreductase (nitroreductase family)
LSDAVKGAAMPKRSEVTDPLEYNRLTAEEFRANHGKVTGDFEGRPILLLTTTGAKSGRERVTPLIYADYADRLIVTAAAGGQPKNPGWYHNIVANPTVRVELGDEVFSVEAVVTSGDDRAAIFAERCASSPAFNEYQQKTNREIPIIALARPKST